MVPSAIQSTVWQSRERFGRKGLISWSRKTDQAESQVQCLLVRDADPQRSSNSQPRGSAVPKAGPSWDGEGPEIEKWHVHVVGIRSPGGGP